MIYLKISNSKAQFKNGQGKYEDIDKIGKNDILNLLNYATDETIEFEMDPIPDNFKGNEAHKIIYSKLYEKFSELLENRSRFIEESTQMYKDAFHQYSQKVDK